MDKKDVKRQDGRCSTRQQDRQIQNRLFAADDRFDEEALIESNRNFIKQRTAKSIREHGEEFTGWISNSKIHLRKPEKDPVGITKGKDGPREYQSWRESRLKVIPNNRENYVFKHYQDTRYYMKQYREENTSLNGTTSRPPKRVSAFYNPGFYNNPSSQQNREHSLLSRITQGTSPPATFNYTRREDNTNNCDRHLLVKYKLTHSSRADSGSSSESDNKASLICRNLPCDSMAIKPFGKTLTRVSVPGNILSGGSNKISNASLSSSSSGVNVKSETFPAGCRTLDTLACVASQEGQTDGDEFEATTPASETSETFGRLSTTCLGGDTLALLKPTTRLEPSCTYHIFPPEPIITPAPTSAPSITTGNTSMMWNPQKSAFERQPVKGGDKDAGINGPFKQARSTNIKPPGTRAKTKTGRDEFPPLYPVGKKGRGCGARSELAEVLGEEKADKEPVLKVQKLASKGRSHSTLCFGETKDKKKLSKVRTPNKTFSKSNGCLMRQGSAGQLDELDILPPEFGVVGFEQEEGPNGESCLPYYKFWNKNSPLRGQAGSGRSRKWYVDNDLNLKNLAELVMTDQETRIPDIDELSRKRFHAPPIASGVTLPPRTLDGLTWREKLEFLRGINKPAMRTKLRPLRLSFFKSDDSDCQMVGCCDPMSRDQVSHQRRIRHLIEQTTMKHPSKNPTDWLKAKSNTLAPDAELGVTTSLNISGSRSLQSKADHSMSKSGDRTQLVNGQFPEDSTSGLVEYCLKYSRSDVHQTAAPNMGQRSFTCIYPEH